ncbi:hypothetical protein BGW38_008647, partial [Lunasporangiospora selenospora]
MSTKHITPAAGVLPEQAPLGSPVPNVPHAISVSLPTFRDNVDYEEAAPRVVKAMVSGYPRFFVALKVKELAEICEKKYGKPTERCFIWPSRKIAERCRHFMERYYVPQPASSISTTSSSNTVRIVEFTIHAPASELKPGGLKFVKIYATLFPEEAFSIGKQYWQHAGEIVSSRLAVHCLRWLSLKAEEDQRDAASTTAKGPATRLTMPRVNRHYSANKIVADGLSSTSPAATTTPSPTTSPSPKQERDLEDQPIEGEDGLDERDYEVYVEERYGRNLDLSFAPKAKVAMKRRIASQVAHHAGSNWTGTSEYVTEDDV